MNGRWHGLLVIALLAAPLPAGAATAPRTVRVALDPGQYRTLSREAIPGRHASLAHGYAALVTAQIGRASCRERVF